MFKHVFFLRKTRNFELEFYFSAYVNKPFFLYVCSHVKRGLKSPSCSKCLLKAVLDLNSISEATLISSRKSSQLKVLEQN